nr:MAG TPA: winged helix-turn-helix transcription repressor [Caudoviricetes sp.]
MLKSINIDLFLSGQAMAHGRKSTLTCVALYKLIEKHSQQHGYCFTKNSTLAAELDKKTSTVKQYLWLMKESGWINVDYHMEGNSLVRDAIRPMLEIDFENATATTANGQVLTEKRSIVKAQTSKPRNKEAEIETEDLSDVIAEESTMPTHTEVDTENKADDEEKPSPVEEYRQNHDREERDKNFMRANEDQQWAYIETLRKKGDTVNANRYEEMITGGMTTEPDNTPEETEEPKEVAVSKPREATRELTTAEQCALQTKNIQADNYDRRNNVIDEDLYHKLKLEVIAESDARKAEEEAQKQQNIQAQQLPANTSAQTSAVATVQQNVPAPVSESPLATPRTSTRKGYDPVLKAFYDAAKALGISIKNNATAQKHVKRLQDVRGDDWCIKYFDFLRINYRSWEYQYKPEIGNELDMIHKAKAIENGMRRMREEQQRKYKVY